MPEQPSLPEPKKFGPEPPTYPPPRELAWKVFAPWRTKTPKPPAVPPPRVTAEPILPEQEQMNPQSLPEPVLPDPCLAEPLLPHQNQTVHPTHPLLMWPLRVHGTEIEEEQSTCQGAKG